MLEQEFNKDRKKYKTKLFSEAINEMKAKICVRILLKHEQDPVTYATIDPTSSIWNFPKKRVGKPRNKWIAETLDQLWRLAKEVDPTLRYDNKEVILKITRDQINTTIIK